MKYFHQLEIPNLSQIIAYARHAIQKDLPLFFRQGGSSSTHLDPLFVANSVHIQNCLEKYNLRCIGALTFIMYTAKDCRIHSDTSVHVTRLNIPIMNCEDTITKFYNVPEWEVVTNEAGTDVWIAKNPDECEVLCSVVVDRPTLLRINYPHRVFMNENKTPRITLSLYFDKDPSFILE